MRAVISDRLLPGGTAGKRSEGALLQRAAARIHLAQAVNQSGDTPGVHAAAQTITRHPLVRPHTPQHDTHLDLVFVVSHKLSAEEGGGGPAGGGGEERGESEGNAERQSGDGAPDDRQRLTDADVSAWPRADTQP